MKIRRARSEDVDRIAPLFDQYRQFYKQIPDMDGARKFIFALLENEASVIFLAEEENEVQGFTQLYPSYSSISMKPLWILNDLFVVPGARRKGVAQALLKEAISFFRAKGARGLTLKTARDNETAQRLYESTGWQRDERFYSYDFR